MCASLDTPGSARREPVAADDRATPARRALVTADDTGTPPGGDLGRCLADFAIDAHDQHCIAGSRLTGAAEPFLRCDKGDANASGLFIRHGNGFFDQGSCLDD